MNCLTWIDKAALHSPEEDIGNLGVGLNASASVSPVRRNFAAASLNEGTICLSCELCILLNSQGCVVPPSAWLVNSLREKAAARRRGANCSPPSQAQTLIAQAEEFEALANVLELQETEQAMPLLPHRRGVPWKLKK